MNAAALPASSITADHWLTQALGTPVFALRLPLPAAPTLAAELARLPDGAFCFAKVPMAETASIGLLEGAGFRVVDTQLTFERAVDPAPAVPGVEVRRAAPLDREAVLGIAGTCFRFSRFHQDRLIGAQAANAVKRAWAANCLDGKRGEEVLVALERGGPAGFLAVLLAKEGSDNVAVIDLVGVATRSQRRGIGAALVEAFIGRWRARATRLRVGTQAANAASIRVYERCGFRFVGAASVLHGHFQGGKAA